MNWIIVVGTEAPTLWQHSSRFTRTPLLSTVRSHMKMTHIMVLQLPSSNSYSFPSFRYKAVLPLNISSWHQFSRAAAGSFLASSGTSPFSHPNHCHSSFCNSPSSSFSSWIAPRVVGLPASWESIYNCSRDRQTHGKRDRHSREWMWIPRDTPLLLWLGGCVLRQFHEHCVSLSYICILELPF